MKQKGKGITYTNNYSYIIIYFMITTTIAIKLFYFPHNQLTFTPISVLAIVLFYFTTIYIYKKIPQIYKRPVTFIKKYPDHYWAQMNYRYLVSKSFDIIFQQTMIIIGVFMLYNAGLPLLTTIFYFFLLFAFIHLIGISTAGKALGMFYFIASLFGAIIFPILILSFKTGFIYSYIIHYSFYIGAGTFVWIRNHKKIRIINAGITRKY